MTTTNPHKRRTRTAVLVGIAAITAGVGACSGGATSPGGVEDGSDATAPNAANDAAGGGEGDGGGSNADGSAIDGSSAPASGFDAGEACTRDAKYDGECAARGQPPVAYVCYDPGGQKIPKACVINQGTLLVCCPD
jgi:hypothetical protein